MKKAVYRLILFAAITAFVLSLSPSVKAEPNDTQTKQNQCIASDTTPLSNADKPEPAPHQNSAGSKENSQLQLVKEQLRGEFYKDSQDNLKLALGIIVAFVGGLILYTIFKDRKEYEKACENAEKAYDKAELSRTQAEQSREKAREHELKAQEKLSSISQLIADKLKEIDAKAKETMYAIKAEAKAGQEEIGKKGNEERQKSLEEAGRQRKIIELFSKGCKAGETKDYETAAECYRQIVEELREENDPDVYINWTDALVHLAKLKGGNDAEDLLKQAEEKCLKAESIKTGKGAYNLACVYVLLGNEDKCKEWLKVREKVGTLPTRECAMADEDLKSVRDKDWFKKLRWKGE